jgi:adenine-specific DNA-methyltransferase
MVQTPYLSKQLIAYIGNKRTLLPFLAGVFHRLEEQAHIRTFLDPFAGSGAVARLAKSLGYRVLANDWEPYARILNEAHVAVDRSEVERMYARFGGIQNAIRHLHGLRRRPGYISKNYAPADTEQADYRTERLFYTRENALFIDTVRDEIERLYGAPSDDRERREKELLIALVLYQAATHANTSGVFKAFHKGFGGHGRDALRRILSPMQLLEPVLIDGAYRCAAYDQGAARFCAEHPADCVYLDPPYNGHQYGSNYFMLNSIALWDQPTVGHELNDAGRLREKAGIRPDWNRTKSPFCYGRSAPEAFRELLGSIDSRFIVLSYNDNGLVPFEELYEMLAQQGQVQLHSSEYVNYRGGRQSPSKAVSSAELALVVDRSRRTTGHDERSVRRKRVEQRLLSLWRDRFDPRSIRRLFPHVGEWVHLFAGENAAHMPDLYYFSGPCPAAAPGELEELQLEELQLEELQGAVRALEQARLSDAVAEAQVLLALLREHRCDGSHRELRRGYPGRLVSCIRKCAHKKYKSAFNMLLADARDLAAENAELEGYLSRELDTIEKRFLQRAAG